jgi:AraC-like DNA-binding protein
MLSTEAIERTDVATRDVVQAHEAIRDTFAGHRLAIRGSKDSFRYRQATVSAGLLSVDALQHTMEVREDVDPIDHTWIGLLAGGQLGVAHAGEEIRALPGDVLLFPQGVPFTSEWQVLSLLLVRFPTEEVARRAAARTGIDPADFRFESMSALSAALGRYSRDTVQYLHSLFRGGDPAIAAPLVRAGALDAAVAAALATFPSTATAADATGPAGKATPAAVRRAIAHVDGHAAEPLSLADIAEASGIGARALQDAFRRHRNTTPTAYLRRVRLERAHRELQATDPTQGATVTAIAARWGFAHPGRFAVAYRRAYGRSPQQTLLS